MGGPGSEVLEIWVERCSVSEFGWQAEELLFLDVLGGVDARSLGLKRDKGYRYKLFHRLASCMADIGQ